MTDNLCYPILHSTTVQIDNGTSECCLLNRYYFQLLASNVLVVHGFFGMIKYFGWKRVRLIAQDEEIYASVSKIIIMMY